MKPATKRPRKKKSETSKDSPPLTETENIPLHMMPKAEKAHINSLLAKAMDEYKSQSLSKYESHKDMSQLTTIVDEYMSAYALIGYTLKDEQVVIFNAKTSKDDSALADLMRVAFINMIQNRP